MIGTTELIIVLVIVLIVFGAGKLPQVMKDLGRGVKSFKSAMDEKEQAAVTKSESPTIEGSATKDKVEQA